MDGKTNINSTLKVLEIFHISKIFYIVPILEDILWKPKLSLVANWEKENEKYYLDLQIHTLGWYDNERIVESLLKNECIKHFYVKWEIGGHYCFKISPYQVGYKLVSEYCNDEKVSRQWIHKKKHRYDWLSVSHNINFIRRNNEN